MKKREHESSRYIDGGAKGAHQHHPAELMDGTVGVSQQRVLVHATGCLLACPHMLDVYTHIFESPAESRMHANP